MLEGVRVPFLSRKAGGFRTVPKDAEELRAVKPCALLRCEEVIRSIGISIPKPSPERRVFVERRLAPETVILPDENSRRQAEGK